MKSENIKYLVASLALGDPFSANLDPGLAEHLDHLEGVDAEGRCKKHLDPQPEIIITYLQPCPGRCQVQ